MSDPALPLKVWPEGITQARFSANDNSLAIEALVLRPCLGVANDEAGSDADGDVWIVGSSPSGAFAGFRENDVAMFRVTDIGLGTGIWYSWEPFEGLRLTVADARKVFDGSVWIDDPSITDGSSGTPGGSDTQVQFNDGGSFGADSGLSYDKSTKALSQGGALNEARGSSIASATLTDIGAATGTFVHVTGTTTITAFGSAQAGARRIVTFDGALILTYNASSLILPTGTDITTAPGDSAIFVSEGSGNWRCVGYMRADGTPIAGGGGGGSLTNWTEAVNTSTPNATVPVVSLSAINAATNVDATVVPKGTGAFALATANNSTSGGNKRGGNSVDLQTSRSGAAQVASGSESVVLGSDNTASGNRSKAIGRGCTASGTDAIAFGTMATASASNAIAIGTSSSATVANAIALFGGTSDAAYAVAIGQGANTNSVASMRSVNLWGLSGRQYQEIELQANTTGATPTTMVSNASSPGATNQFSIGASINSAAIVTGLIVARQTGSGGVGMAWKFEAHMNRSSNTLTLVNAVTPTLISASAGPPAWTVAVTADNTNNVLKVEVTGAAATTIRWGCHIKAMNVPGS